MINNQLSGYLPTIGGELYSSVGVETPIEAGGHLYQINRTLMANLQHPQHPHAFLEQIITFPASTTTEAICIRLVSWMTVMSIFKRTWCLILIEPLLMAGLKKSNIAVKSKMTTEYIGRRGKVAAPPPPSRPTCMMADKGEWNNLARTNPWRSIKIVPFVISFKTRIKKQQFVF